MMTLLESLHLLGGVTQRSVWLPLAAWTVFALLILGALRAWPSLPARLQHDVRAGLLLTLPLGLLAAALTDFYLPLPWPNEPTSVTALPTALPAPPGGTESLAPASLPWAWDVFHLLGALTLAGLGAMTLRVLRLVLDALALGRHLQRLQPVPAPHVEAAAQTLAAEMGVRRRVRVVVTPYESVPMTYGWLRPTIVLPASLVYDNEQVRLTLLHELIHIRHHDYIVQGLARLIEAVFAIHPLTWTLRRSLAYYREAACDAEVLAQPAVNGKRYATLLYRFVRPYASRRRLALRMSVPEHELKKRILAMNSLIDTPNRWNKSSVGLVLGLVLVAAGSLFVACADFVSPSLTESNRETSESADVFVVVEEMPELIGGLEALHDQIQYPAIAKKAGIEGRVYVQFVVDEDGRVIEPEVVRGVGAGLDAEALRVVQQATFEPGRQRGNAVPVKMSLPISFTLDGSGPQAHERPAGAAHVHMEMPERVGVPKLAADGTYLVAEQMPVLEGGLPALQRELAYPAIARRAGIEGRVFVQFVVDEHGRVVEPRIVKGIGGGCDEEALRVVRQARFRPGRVEGRSVPVRMSVPVTFRLDGPSTGEAHFERRQVPSVPPRIKITDLRRVDGMLHGRVVDAATGEPLVGAAVVAEDGKTGSATGPDGRFAMGVPENLDDFAITFVGFERETFTMAPGLSPPSPHEHNTLRLPIGATSIRVMSNGETLKEGSDYTIDHAAGTVTIINPNFLGPDRVISLKVDA